MVDLLDAWEAATNRAGVEDVAGHPDAPPPSSPEGAPGEPQSPTTAVLTNLAYEMRGDLAIVVHNDRTPTDEDHFATLDIMRRARAGTVKRALTVTSGGTPTALQRKSYNEALAGHEMLTAIVSDKAVVRRVVALLTWHNSNIRAFSRKKIDQALTFLGVPSEDRPEVLRRVHFLETELSRRPRRGR